MMMDNVKNSRVAKNFILKNKLWNYRGEGNANLVLSVFEERKVIRLRKSLPEETIEHQIWLEINFCRCVMQPLLGERFVNVPEVVRLLESDLAELKEKLLCLRPVRRQVKGIYGSYATVHPDLCLLPPSSSDIFHPTFCVEVKPKQGWIPFPDRRLSKCTFCLNQYLKLKQGIVKEISQYCPLDLFSGNRRRMKHALKALLACPQNNFKLFKNGHLVYGDASTQNVESILEDWFCFKGADVLVDNFVNLVIDTLLNDFKSESDVDVDVDMDPTIPSSYSLDTFDSTLTSRKKEGSGLQQSRSQETVCSRIPQCLLDEAESLLPGPSCYNKDCDTLPKNCVLSRILGVQKLDSLGSDEVYRLHRAQHVQDDFAYVCEMLMFPRSMFKPVSSYLLATTAKDCSILMTFRETLKDCMENMPRVKSSNGIYYSFDIGLSDLDPKPASAIEKHRKRDIEIVKSCIETLRTHERNC